MRRFIETAVMGIVAGTIILAGGRVLGIDPTFAEMALVSILCCVWSEAFIIAHDRELQRRWVSRNTRKGIDT